MLVVDTKSTLQLFSAQQSQQHFSFSHSSRETNEMRLLCRLLVSSFVDVQELPVAVFAVRLPDNAFRSLSCGDEEDHTSRRKPSPDMADHEGPRKVYIMRHAESLANVKNPFWMNTP